MTTTDCGTKAACCHIGASHRHCEHCDAVLFAALEHRGETDVPTAAAECPHG